MQDDASCIPVRHQGSYVSKVHLLGASNARTWSFAKGSAGSFGYIDLEEKRKGEVGEVEFQGIFNS